VLHPCVRHGASSKHKPVNELSLFSGYGGMTLALKLAGLEVTTVGYVEIDHYCQQLIQARIRDNVLDDAPIWADIRAFDGRQCRGVVDIITASFPCQPHSSANKTRRGRSDERNLWPDTLRVIREVAPRYVLLENVRGLADGDNPYAAEILGQLSEAGYDARWGLLSAAEVGAPHLRERWWWMAPTPKRGEGLRLWPTPTATSYGTGNNYKANKGQPATHRPSLQTMAKRAGGILNPRWIEWLQGVPIGWTNLKPLAMESYQQWWRSFSGGEIGTQHAPNP